MVMDAKAAVTYGYSESGKLQFPQLGNDNPREGFKMVGWVQGNDQREFGGLMLMKTLMKMKKLAAWLLTLCLCASPAFAVNDEREEDRVKDAGEVMKEILDIPDDIPQDLLDKAECLVILPSVKKGAFGVGGSYGRGVMICRSGQHYTGPWGPPALYALEGVSIGFQLGGQATDFVLLVMNPKGARSLL